MPIPLLALVDLSPAQISCLEDSGFALSFAVDPVSSSALSSRAGVRGVVTNGSTGLSAAQMYVLPELEIVCALGAGYENIDLAAAGERGIIVANGPGTNAQCVAEHALTLMLALTRDIVAAHQSVRRGEWASSRHLRPTVRGKRLGILGLGSIGAIIASRAATGFDMEIGYHNRSIRVDAPYLYFDNLRDLAMWSDYLVVIAPGGSDTWHMINQEIFSALGPNGFLVNVSRGSLVDTPALLSALQNGEIAGAALDVIEGEPHIPYQIAETPNLILTPHIAGRSPESSAAMISAVIDNLSAHFFRRELPLNKVAA